MFDVGSDVVFRYSALDVSVRGRECGYVFTQTPLSTQELKFMKNVDINTRGTIICHIKQSGKENSMHIKLSDGRFVVVPAWVLGVV